MKNTLLILTTIFMFSYSCKTTNNIQNKVDNVIITFDKKSGRGINPTYSIKIFESGLILFNGVKNTAKIGKYKKQLDKKELKSLSQKFIDADFFSFKDEYTSKITDLPTTYISFTDNGKTKKIRDYYGSPVKLKELEKIIENIVNENDWTEIE